ncbi:Major facilitator superfamily domain general substrate transporter [Penicillium cataractarum]|uniref:Major facilitator superfamily domain general substrate transporter n=1 Tax=Penicillium cataractarum TaxID=2100454 RepID=A0A9W9SJ44_9EURO|nr:Major facilitator superfamily domain general substrate transporter [Penicillium cataractarum]KAJ5378229.1 Major facilitator superfamily domain general substrate transporter [Penicillium cataractarum]
MSPGWKWVSVMFCALNTLGCFLASTIFAGAIFQIKERFNVSEEVSILTVCLFVLGFAVGSVIWGPLCELYGRQTIWLSTLGASILFEGTSIACSEKVPETYGPYILRRRAAKSSKETGKAYISKLDAGILPKTLGFTLSTSIVRPIVMAVFELISTAMALYTVIVYGILYLIFAAFLIAFIDPRHWGQGVSGLAYIVIMIGQIVRVPFYVVLELKYRKTTARPGIVSTPKMRLEPALYGAISLPISLSRFACTSYPSIHWAIGIVGTILFGLGNVLVFITMTNYIIDTYSLFAATAALPTP